MKEFEMVETLRERANVTYEEAKAALEISNWNLLEAMVLLEREGKVNNYQYTTEFSTAKNAFNSHGSHDKNNTNTDGKKNRKDFRGGINNIFQEIKRLFQKGNERNFEIEYGRNSVISIPLSIAIILLIILSPAIPFLLFVIIVAYFLGVRFNITKAGEASAKDKEETSANADVNVATDATASSNSNTNTNAHANTHANTYANTHANANTYANAATEDFTNESSVYNANANVTFSDATDSQ